MASTDAEEEMASPSMDWEATSSNVGAQGLAFADLRSPSGKYLAFLSKGDYNDSTDTWDILFEMMPDEWTAILMTSAVIISAPPQPVPALLYHLPSVAGQDVIALLGLPDQADIAEGSWFLLTLSDTPGGEVSGDLYDPDIDVLPTANDYGTYWTIAAIAVAFPALDGNNNLTLTPAIQLMAEITQLLLNTFRPVSPPMAIQGPASKSLVDYLLFNTNIVAVNVNDVGQGNCNMLIDQNLDVAAYFDVGFPLYFYVSSAPSTLKLPFPSPGGPITQNQPRNLFVILSHWDWDHWRLGRVGSLGGILWVVPKQAMGPAASNFLAQSLLNVTIWPDGLAYHAEPTGCAILKCVPPPGASKAFLMNNSGLAVVFTMPTQAGTVASVVLTADANLDTLPNLPYPGGSVWMTAVHHGSKNHGAASGLLSPSFPYNGQGRIAYSYGITSSGTYAYGFPSPPARQAYQTAGWTVENSTAESVYIRGNPPPPSGQLTTDYRGNIRIGNQQPLVAYNYTAFYPFPNWLN